MILWLEKVGMLCIIMHKTALTRSHHSIYGQVCRWFTLVNLVVGHVWNQWLWNQWLIVNMQWFSWMTLRKNGQQNPAVSSGLFTQANSKTHGWDSQPSCFVGDVR